jgi:hypothetical protein
VIECACQFCGTVFQTWPYKLRNGRAKYCSRSCLNLSQTGQSRPGRPIEERFWEKVAISGPDDCWLWLGAKTKEGYGSIGHNGRVRRATHVSWELRYGAPFPPRKLACHTCDNPPCVNPAHIFVGTKQENADDMARKGRSIKGLHREFCRRGHKRTPENTYSHKNGIWCRVCRRERDHAVSSLCASIGAAR